MGRAIPEAMAPRVRPTLRPRSAARAVPDHLRLLPPPARARRLALRPWRAPADGLLLVAFPSGASLVAGFAWLPLRTRPTAPFVVARAPRAVRPLRR